MSCRALGRRMRAAALSFLLACALAPSVEALCAAPWQRIPESGREMLRPAPLVLVGLAATSPIAFIPTGADHDLRVFSQTDLGGSHWAEPVSPAAPYVLLPALGAFYAGAVWGDWCEAQKPAAAILQGTLEAALVYGIAKVASGRRWPVWGEREGLGLDEPERARDFAPFQRIEQELGAFPSGHTAFMFAAAAALRASSPEYGWWRYIGYPFAAGMGFLMWFGDHHWVSDIVSGALVGEAIGGAAGRAWAPRPDEPEISWSITPTPGGAAFQVSGAF